MTAVEIFKCIALVLAIICLLCAIGFFCVLIHEERKEKERENSLE